MYSARFWKIVDDGPAKSTLSNYQNKRFVLSKNSLSKDTTAELIKDKLTVVVSLGGLDTSILSCLSFFSKPFLPVRELIFIASEPGYDINKMIAESFADYPRFRVVEKNNQEQVVDVFNRILKSISTEYVHFSDQDHKFDEGFFAETVQKLALCPAAALISCDVVSKETGVMNLAGAVRLSSAALDGGVVSAEKCKNILTAQGSWFASSSIVFNHSMLLKSGIFNAALEGFALDMKAQQLSLRHGCLHVSKKLVTFGKRHSTSLEATLKNKNTFAKLVEDVNRELQIIGDKDLACRALQRLTFSYYFCRLKCWSERVFGIQETSSIDKVSVSKPNMLNQFLNRVIFCLGISLYLC